MKILAIDSSSLVASIAILEDDILVAEYTVNFKKTHSQTLLPMIEEISKMIELDMNTIDCIAIAGGPGSFTGLRIGSATAKGLGLALNKPIVNVPTIDAMAYNLYGINKLICPIMDARRNQVYTGAFTFDGEKFEVLMNQCAISIDELIDYLKGQDQEVIFLGDAVPVHRGTIDKELIIEHSYAPAHMNRQRAGAVAALAYEYYKRGQVESPEEHKPDYLRLSQAERERAEKESKDKL